MSVTISPKPINIKSQDDKIA